MLKATDLNKLVQGGQLYCYFLFSKSSQLIYTENNSFVDFVFNQAMPVTSQQHNNSSTTTAASTKNFLSMATSPLFVAIEGTIENQGEANEYIVPPCPVHIWCYVI
jgi:hypothetical protein